MNVAFLSTLGPGRAVETGKRAGLLHDPAARAMVDAIDYDFARFDGSRSLYGSVVRTTVFDHWVHAFVRRHPGATVIELGTGLNTRFERVDNGRLHWVDLDLPDVIELRRRFFTDTPRRRMIAASMLDDSWPDVARAFPGPYLLVAEASLIYLPEADAHRTLAMAATRFPGAEIAFDTCGAGFVHNQQRHDVLASMNATLTWVCDDPRVLERAVPGLRLAESCTFAHLPRQVSRRLPARYLAAFPVIGRLSGQVRAYRFNLFGIDRSRKLSPRGYGRLPAAMAGFAGRLRRGGR